MITGYFFHIINYEKFSTKSLHYLFKRCIIFNGYLCALLGMSSMVRCHSADVSRSIFAYEEN